MSKMLWISICFSLISALNGYTFSCLDKCDCDTSEGIIQCGNGGRTELELPSKSKLSGFKKMMFTDNNLISLPDEQEILEKYPDLRVINLEKNPNFSCSLLFKFERINVITDCDKNNTITSDNTEECNLSCQTSKNYANIRMYAVSLWRTVVEKYESFDLNETLQAIYTFFSDLMRKINGEDVKDEVALEPHEMVTPMTMLKEMDVGEEVDVPKDTMIHV